LPEYRTTPCARSFAIKMELLCTAILASIGLVLQFLTVNEKFRVKSDALSMMPWYPPARTFELKSELLCTAISALVGKVL
jgi:hypothetical protein